MERLRGAAMVLARMCASPTGTDMASPRQLPGLTPAFLQVWWFDEDARQPVAGAVEALMGTARGHARNRSPAEQPSLLAVLLAPAAAAETEATASRPSAISHTRRISSISPMSIPDAPKGGRILAGRLGLRHHLQQPEQLHSEGRRGAGDGAAVRHADGAGGRRARRGLRAGGRERPRSPTTASLHLPSAARGAVPRRHAAHRRRRRVLASTSLKEKGHPIYRADAREMVQGRGARPAHRALHASPASWSRDLPLTVAACRSSPRPITRRTPSTRPRSTRRSAPAPIRSATSSGALPSSIERGPGLLGQGPAGQSRAAAISTRSASNISATARRVRGVQGGRHTTSARSSPRKIWATEYDFPADPRRQGEEGSARRRDAVRHAGLLPQHAARASSQDPRVREALDLAFDFEWTNRNLFYGAYTRTQSYFENSDDEGRGPAVARRSSTLLEPFGVPVCRPRRSASAYVPPKTRRLGPGPQAAAPGRQAARRGRLEASRTAVRVNAKASRSSSSS